MTLRLNGSTSGYTEIDAPAVAGSNTLVLPTGNGTSGQVLTTNGSGALSWSGMGPAFAAYANAATSISNVTNTKISLGTEEFDTANCFASSRFTPNVAGYYQFNYSIRMGNILTARADLAKNGAVIKSGAHIGGNTYVSFGAHLIYMNGSADYIELFAYQASGGTQNVESSLDTSLSGFLARPA
jgi:hypothetical protein